MCPCFTIGSVNRSCKCTTFRIQVECCWYQLLLICAPATTILHGKLGRRKNGTRANQTRNHVPRVLSSIPRFSSVDRQIDTSWIPLDDGILHISTWWPHLMAMSKATVKEEAEVEPQRSKRRIEDTAKDTRMSFYHLRIARNPRPWIGCPNSPTIDGQEEERKTNSLPE